MMKKKRLTFDELNAISQIAIDNIDIILEGLGIDYVRKSNKSIRMSCPIHGGDNESALTIYLSDYIYPGFWRCWSGNCHKKFKPNILGFVYGVLSARNPNCGFDDAINFVKNHLGIDRVEVNNSFDNDLLDYICYDDYSLEYVDIDEFYRRTDVVVPCNYMISRGISKEMCIEYRIGVSNKLKRSIIPVFDVDNKCVGFTGRILYDKCKFCNKYHPENSICMFDDTGIPKWKHFFLKSSNVMFNINVAKDYDSVIIVEGPIDCLRLITSGIRNCVCVFGNTLSEKQISLLFECGFITVYLAFDNDDAGMEGFYSSYSKLDGYFRLHKLDYPAKDIGCLTDEQIKQVFTHAMTRC